MFTNSVKSVKSVNSVNSVNHVKMVKSEQCKQFITQCYFHLWWYFVDLELCARCFELEDMIAGSFILIFENRLNNLTCTLFQMLSSNNIITFFITRIQPLWDGNDFCWWFQVCKGSKNDTKNLLWYFPAILYLVSPGVFREEAITVQMVFVAEAENNCASSASLNNV